MEFKRQDVWTYNVTIDDFKVEDIPEEARAFVQKGVVPQLVENGFECESYDCFVDYTPRPQSMNMMFILLRDTKQGMLFIYLPASIGVMDDVCEHLDEQLEKALRQPYETHYPWSQQEVNLRWLDLIIQELDHPEKIDYVWGMVCFTLPEEYVRRDKEGTDMIFHNGICVGKLDHVFHREVYGIFMKHQYEFEEEAINHIKAELIEFRRYYIHIFRCDSLYDKIGSDNK